MVGLAEIGHIGQVGSKSTFTASRLVADYFFQPWAAVAGLYFFALTWASWKYVSNDIPYIVGVVAGSVGGLLWMVLLMLTMDGTSFFSIVRGACVFTRRNAHPRDWYNACLCHHR